VEWRKKQAQLNKKWMPEVGLLLSFGGICVWAVSLVHDMTWVNEESRKERATPTSNPIAQEDKSSRGVDFDRSLPIDI